MEELIAEMRERIQNRPGRRYDDALKADILALVAEMRSEGISKKRIVKALGTNWTTIESWMEKPKTVVPVVLKPSPKTESTVTLRSPNGWHVDVSVSDLKTLL